jgi:hypothetical protein
MAKNIPIIPEYAYRKAPKDIDWHFIINEVKYVEDFMSRLELAYDEDIPSTISLLARYYRNYKGFEKAVCDDLILDYIQRYYREKMDSELVGDFSYTLKKIQHATSLKHYSDNHGGKPLRDFDGIYITQEEIDKIWDLRSLEEQEVLFACLCFTKMYNETNRRQGRKINNLFYVSTPVLRRCIGWKKGTNDKLEETMKSLMDKGYLGFVENRDKYERIIGRTNQPFVTRQCKIVSEGENVLFIDNFDTLGLAWQFISGNKTVKKCDCGRYFQVTSNRQKKCKKCNPKVQKSRKKSLKKMRKRK